MLMMTSINIVEQLKDVTRSLGTLITIFEISKRIFFQSIEHYHTFQIDIFNLEILFPSRNSHHHHYVY